MSRTQYYTATTVDGFIADEDNSLSWLFEVPGDPAAQAEEWKEFIGQVGALAMGATTYEWVLDHERLLEHPERWHAFYGDRPTWVFTHRDLPVVPGLDIRFASGDVAPLHADMVEAARRRGEGRNVWLVGGGDLVGQFDDAGLLDEVRLSMMPVTLGAGAPLLPRRITSRRLTLRSVKQMGQQVSLVYDVAPVPE
jgi:dihydrofolate reductase